MSTAQMKRHCRNEDRTILIKQHHNMRQKTKAPIIPKTNIKSNNNINNPMTASIAPRLENKNKPTPSPSPNKLITTKRPLPYKEMATSVKSSFLPGARCGEIFVANNARQWTFICTFCNKSTRDIDDFVYHIKMRHLQESEEGFYNEEDDDNECDEQLYGQDVSKSKIINSSSTCHSSSDLISGGSGNKNFRFSSSKAIEIIPIHHRHHHPEQEVSKKQFHSILQQSNALTISKSMEAFWHSGKSKSAAVKDFSYATNTAAEYLDCGSYLDVSMHTEEERDAETASSKKIKNAASPIIKNRIKLTKSAVNPATKKNNLVIDLDEEDDDEAGDTNSNDIEMQIVAHTSKRALGKKSKKLHKNSNADLRNGSDYSLEQQAMDFDEEQQQFPHTNSSTNDEYTSQFNNYEVDDDFDNQLLIAPSDDAIEQILTTPDGSELKVKRRQIRGTAYCALCNRTFQYYSLYRNHMIKHSNETPFKCSLCKRGFKSKQAIRYHMNTHKREKEFQCELCDAGYYTENQLITHVLTHESGSIFPCMVCGKILKSDKERDQHLPTHNEERPFRCEYCNKLFRLRHHLSNHLKLHRQYRCEYCKEEFNSAIFQRKPYACAQCEHLPEEQRLSLAVRVADTNDLRADASEINPLQLYENVDLSKPAAECVDLAEMVTESEQDDDDDSLENGDRRQGGVLQDKRKAGLTLTKDEQDYDEKSDEDEDENYVENYDEDSDDDDDDNDNLLTPQRIVNMHTFSPIKHAEGTTERLSCPHCPRTYSRISGLNYHIRTKHGA